MRDELLKGLTGSLEEYRRTADPLIAQGTSPAMMTPIQIGFKGQSYPILTGSQRFAQDQASAIADRIQDLSSGISQVGFASGKDLSELKSDIAQKLAGLRRDALVTHTPNTAAFKYFNTINPIVQQAENRRYGLPSQTKTIESPMSIFDRAAGGVALYNALTKPTRSELVSDFASAIAKEMKNT